MGRWPLAAAMDRTGDQFLARARLTEHKHVYVRRRDLLDQLEHAAHRRAGADDVVEGVRPLDLPPQERVLVAQPPCTEQPLDRAGDIAGHERLGKVIGCAETQTRGHAFDAGLVGQQDYGEAAIDLLRGLEDGKAIDCGRTEGHHREIERAGFERLGYGGGVGLNSHLDVAERAQGLLDGRLGCAVVVGHQDSCVLHSWLTQSSAVAWLALSAGVLSMDKMVRRGWKVNDGLRGEGNRSLLRDLVVLSEIGSRKQGVFVRYDEPLSTELRWGAYFPEKTRGLASERAVREPR